MSVLYPSLGGLYPCSGGEYISKWVVDVSLVSVQVRCEIEPQISWQIDSDVSAIGESVSPHLTKL